MYCRQKIQKDFNSTVQNETEKTEKYGTGKCVVLKRGIALEIEIVLERRITLERSLA